jgi:acyl-CoA thioesterase I
MIKSLLLFLVLLAPTLANPVMAASSQATQAPVILVTGDSLSAAYGIGIEEGWVALLQKRLQAQGYPHRVVNTSVSGETTRGALARLPSELSQHKPAIVLIELGANDGLRGQSLKTMRENLARMVRLSQRAGARPVLFEMMLPANYGQQYTEDFRKSFANVARANGVPLLPFLLNSIALDPEAFQSDGIHPTAASQPRLLDAIWPALKPLLDRSKTAGG